MVGRAIGKRHFRNNKRHTESRLIKIAEHARDFFSADFSSGLRSACTWRQGARMTLKSPAIISKLLVLWYKFESSNIILLNQQNK